MSIFKNFKNKILYWSQLFLIPLYGLSFLVPRNKNIWLFGSTFGRRFADNPRYMFLYTSQNLKNEVRAVWISHNKEIVKALCDEGYEAYYDKSIKGIWMCLRGGVYFYDNYPKDISQWLSGGATKINLWHGIPLKKIQMDNIHDKVRHPDTKFDAFRYALRRFTDEKPSHYILSSSEFFVPIFSSAFATEKVITAGLPRTDIYTGEKIKNIYLASEKGSLDKINKCLEAIRSEGKRSRIFLYMPTFRDSETKFFETVDLNRLGTFLKERGYLLCLKLHCKSKLKERFDAIESDNIVVIDPNADPYVFVGMADVLITDYSSIYFDFLLTGRGVIFFDYDLEDYLSNSREMYFDYEQFTPGDKAQTTEELFELMDNPVKPEQKYRQILEKAFGDRYTDFCEQLKNEVQSI